MSIVCCRVSEEFIEVASDSIVVRGVTQGKSKNIDFSKLFKIHDRFIIGGVGTAEEIALLRMYCKGREPANADETSLLEFIVDFAEWKEKRTSKYSIGSTYIIVFGGKAFCVEGFFVHEVLTYEAIGAGMDYALSTLYLGHDVTKAITTASELSIYCELPVVY